ncbi:MAG: hypothetical protein IPP61_06215 [Cytophagaceae bacterium]|nr:hypothetical protein [Cytophagaceae bacterium]MBK9935492.1 hypothetical protein [Cytophagaceae bacterium]MBL0324761.1 hypothetical protein [Cytophagaceae bacterium]
MSFLHFIKLLFRNLIWLISIPVILAASVYFFTRNEKKVYSSESIIYTGIASGYSLNGTNKADFYSTSNAFDNLISLIDSRETKEDVSISLLAEHLQKTKSNSEEIGYEALGDLNNLIDEKTKKKLKGATVEKTKENILKMMNSSDDNLIIEIINSTNPYYSLKALNTIKANRISNSDLIKISYETNDPGICKRTLELLEHSFMRKHRLLKEGQTESVVKYFEEETEKAFAKLDSSERLFLQFNKQYDIINYYEQTKAIAGEKEDLYALNHSLEMDKHASDVSLKKVNSSIKNRVYQNIYNTQILEERKELSKLYTQITTLQLAGSNATESQKHDLENYKAQVADKEKNLKKSLESLYKETNTVEGIPTKDILDEWLKTTLTFEQSKARLAVMDERKKEFDQEYKRYAPLGAMLKKIERQIEVSEEAYLELLHGLSMARLNQQNAELTTKLNVVDPPYLPVQANRSKRMLQVALSFVVGFVMVLAFILVNALINKTLLEPQRAAKLIDIPFLGLFPLTSESPRFMKMSKLRLVQQLLSKIEFSDNKVIKIGLASTERGEGKSTIAEIIKYELEKLRYEIEIIQWEPMNSKDLESNNSAQVIIYELPSFDSLIIKPGTFPVLDLTILLARANRVWTRIDKEMLAIFRNTTGTKPWLLLNGVETDFAEEYIGEVPKNRNYFRRILKQIVKFQFGQRRKIK